MHNSCSLIIIMLQKLCESCTVPVILFYFILFRRKLYYSDAARVVQDLRKSCRTFCYFILAQSGNTYHRAKFSNQEVLTLEPIFFACRVIIVWNSLPDSVSFTSLAVLRDQLELLILASSWCVIVSVAYVALLPCMHILTVYVVLLLCK